MELSDKDVKEILMRVNSMIELRKGYLSGVLFLANQGQPLDGFSLLANYNQIADDIIKIYDITKRK